MNLLVIGNAHEETARQRSRGRSMAKFIHYYTRYKAHGESALLESRIRRETIMRIKISLRQSDRGDLEWFQRGLVPHPYEGLTEDEARAYKLLDGTNTYIYI